jgi:hypothetical protein
MSRMPAALAFLFAAAGSPASAQRPVTAEQAMKDYREKFTPTAILDCPRDRDQIVVCGKRPEVDPNRPPLPVERQAGSFIPGEPRGMGPDCHSRCPQPLRIDIMKAAPAVVEGIKKILDPDR